MRVRTAYLDIETTYVGAFTDSRLFQDFANHKITVVGIRVMDGDHDVFVQLVGGDVTLANLMAALEGV